MAKAQWRALTELKTEALVPWCRENLFRCDPYLVWADATTVVSARPELNIAVLIELVSADDLAELRQHLNQDAGGEAQHRFQSNGFEPFPPSRFVTALVDRRGLALLVTDVVNQRIKRFTLQDSRVDIAEAIQSAHLNLAKETLMTRETLTVGASLEGPPQATSL